jgi:hypothetical protein
MAVAIDAPTVAPVMAVSGSAELAGALIVVGREIRSRWRRIIWRR